jgi:signal transduction histidine kinase
MLHLRDLSIRFKVLGLIALSSFLSLAIAGAAMIVYDLVVFKRTAVAELTVQAQMLGAISSAALIFNDPKAATEYLATLRARPNIECAAIYTGDGKLFAHYERSENPGCALPAAQADGHDVLEDDLVLFKSIQHNRERVGTVFVRQNLGRTERALGYTGIVAAVLLGALALGLLVSTTMQRAITQPLLGIAKVARGVTERRDFSLRAVKMGNDEVGLMTDALNQMLAEIERSAAELQRANEQLQVEIAEHRHAREEVIALNATLEQRVAERTQALELANKELETFSYSVSHDLRTPLRAIEGFSSVLMRDQADRLDERGREHLQRVRAATQRMARLIDDLLNLARTMRVEVRRHDVKLSEMASTVAKEISDAHPDRKVHFDIAPHLNANADPQLVRVVLDNLLGNAAKFSSRKADARVEFGSTMQNGEAVYYVRDNGVGFDMAYANKLFGAFQRLHSTKEFEGTGIGLANAQRIIARHGGRIWAEGRPERGATFYFTLPA